MMRLPHFPASLPLRATTAGVMLALAAGCASIDIEQSVGAANRDADGFTQGHLELALTDSQRAERTHVAAELLQRPVTQASAVQLALVNSPALQAMLAQHWADGALIAQAGRMSNPIFTFERLRQADELELGRLLSFGLLDLVLLPHRYGLAQRRLQQAQLRLTLTVVDQVTQVRQAWVRAVAAQQMLAYAGQVNEVARISAELAGRMQVVGNVSKLQRARQQAFYADAATQWAGAQQSAVVTRERLVRLLGLDDRQAAALVLPDRLPDLPATPLASDVVSRAASRDRLDVRLAGRGYEAAMRAQGLSTIDSVTDIELGVRRDTVTDDDGKQHRTGFEVSVRLPVFDSGAMRRSALSAQALAAANALEATMRAAGSSLRENYAGYRSAYDVSRHYRDEVLPLRKVIADENVLRYNGMLIGVFELLADTRSQIDSVTAAIAAEREFWLADAALQAAIMGRPMAAPLTVAMTTATEE